VWWAPSIDAERVVTAVTCIPASKPRVTRAAPGIHDGRVEDHHQLGEGDDAEDPPAPGVVQSIIVPTHRSGVRCDDVAVAELGVSHGKTFHGIAP